jgi:hypothetical protein
MIQDALVCVQADYFKALEKAWMEVTNCTPNTLS